jgi:L-asparaginase
MIHLLFTGGTISMHRDASAGGNVPAHGGEELVGFAPGLDRIAPYRIENWARVPACHLDPARLWALRDRVCEVAESGDVSGIVVTHGTDVLEETAYLLARTLPGAVPIAITGAMRTSSDEGWDGPRNLLDAARVAASPESAGRGAMVVCPGENFAAETAVKTHATGLAAFSAPHAGALGRVVEGRVLYERPAGPRLPPLRPREGLTARVALVPVVVGDDGTMLDLARPEHDGVVVEAFGSGNIPPGAVPAVRRWLEDGKPVVLASRCLYGEVTPLYAFDGGGARTVALGAIPAGSRTPSQARLELALALSAGIAYGAR